MCGIAGHINGFGVAGPLDLETLLRRGPDGHGQWMSEDKRVWLGSTRLAILDLSELGTQAMQDPDTGNVIVFNMVKGVSSQ
jgi:asparagine synthase (glutamine-hydrolysing)